MSTIHYSGLLNTVSHFGLGTEILAPSDSNKLRLSRWWYRLRILLSRIEPLSFNSLLVVFGRFHKTAKSFVISACPSAPTVRIFTKFDIWVFFDNLSRIVNFHWNMTRITGTLRENLRTFMISRWILLRQNYYRQKLQTETEHTFYVQQSFPKNRVVCHIMWKNMVRPERPQMTI